MSEIKVDTVAEKTSANGVTVDGLNIKDSKLVTANSVITSNITDANITTAKIADVNVTEGKIADNAITLAKMASGTDGNIISYDASGNPVAIATGSDGQVLTSTGAGSPPAFETLASAANTPAFSAYAPSDQHSLSDNTWVKLTIDGEFFDSDGKYNTSNYRFTPTVAGKYMFGAAMYIDGTNTVDTAGLAFYKNGSKLFYQMENVDAHSSHVLTAVIDLDGDDYVELYGYADIASNGTWAMNIDGTTANNRTFWYGYKLII